MISKKEVIKGLKEIHDEAYSRFVHCQYTRDEIILGIGKYMDDALAYLKQNDWISVKDKLPEPGIYVLIYGTPKEDPEHTDGKIAITLMSNYPYIVGNRTVDPYWVMPWQYFSVDYEITHWMPLPNAPEGVTGIG
jgi:hypothetical protein